MHNFFYQDGYSHLYMDTSNGMSKVLEDDLRAHHFTLKALKEQLEAKLKRLKV